MHSESILIVLREKVLFMKTKDMLELLVILIQIEIGLVLLVIDSDIVC